MKEPKYVYTVEELFDISELPKSNIKSDKIEWIIDKSNEDSAVLQRAEKTHKPRAEKEKEKENDKKKKDGVNPSPDASPTNDSDCAGASSALPSAAASKQELMSSASAANVTPKRPAASSTSPTKAPAQTPQNDRVQIDKTPDPNCCKELAGTWVVKYSNHFEHHVSIKPNGDISSDKLPGPCVIRPCTDPPGWFHVTPWFLEENHKEFLFPDSQGNLQIRHWIDGDFVCKAVGYVHFFHLFTFSCNSYAHHFSVVICIVFYFQIFFHNSRLNSRKV